MPPHTNFIINFTVRYNYENGAKCNPTRSVHMLCSIPAEAILSKIQEAGFTVSLSKETHLTKEMAEQLYHEQKGKEFFNDLTDLMSR